MLKVKIHSYKNEDISATLKEIESCKNVLEKEVFEYR